MSKGVFARSLKSMNRKWLVMLASFDMFAVLALIALAVPNDRARASVPVVRCLVKAFLPVIVLVLLGMLSHLVKAKLVFWKLINPFPGCEAFSRHGPADVRIDMSTLKENVGEFPADPTEQNKKWFKLYREVADDLAVVEAHRLYLMYRDMAALSFCLTLVVPFGLYLAGGQPTFIYVAAVIFVAQYLGCCVSSQNAGRRLVCGVLAVHSTEKLTATDPTSL